MPVRHLPSHPSLDHLKHQAKDLLKQHQGRLRAAAQKIQEFHPRFASSSDAQIFDAPIQLSDAQLTLARSHGFASWVRLKRHIEAPTHADQLQLPHHERIEDPLFRRAVELIDAGDEAGLQRLLKANPKLVRQHVLFEGGNYFRTPTLLEFIAENPIRHGRLPANIVAVARVLLEAGPSMAARNEALGLVATGRVPRECGVQEDLIALLCEYGAQPEGALAAAAAHGEFGAVRALVRHGATMDLAVAAALGEASQCDSLLPLASGEQRALGLALAAQFGHTKIVKRLLDAGEDASRYNPAGAHAHSTPLHQAAQAGHQDVVKLLVAQGARLDVRDTMFNGTAADWAEHAGKVELARWLREQERAAGPEEF